MSGRWEGESVPLPKQMTSELAAFTLGSIVAIVHDGILYRCSLWDPFEETRGNSGSWHVRSVHRFFSVTSIFLQRRSVDCRARARARVCACVRARVCVCVYFALVALSACGKLYVLVLEFNNGKRESKEKWKTKWESEWANATNRELLVNRSTEKDNRKSVFRFLFLRCYWSFYALFPALVSLTFRVAVSRK